MPKEESQRLEEKIKEGVHPWKKWGPYVSERAWGTVREDYSADGDAWNYFPHDMARSRAYRWGEDGIAGFSDIYQTAVFSLGLWNGKDPILKERLFGLSSTEGNHGEDVKECYYYIDSTPTHSYMKYLYKYPQNAYPYQKLIDENKRRSTLDKEYELQDSGIFDRGEYFDIQVEYAKKGPDDILIRIEISNRADHEASIWLLPQLLFRNTWSWEEKLAHIPEIKAHKIRKKYSSIYADPTNLKSPEGIPYTYKLKPFYLYAENCKEMLFTNNETHAEKVWGNIKSRTPYVKDAFHRYVIGKQDCLNPEKKGTKAAFYYPEIKIEAYGKTVIHLRLCPSSKYSPFENVTKLFKKREKEADDYYKEILGKNISADETLIARQALSGMLWSKQYYYYNVNKWLEGDKAGAPPPPVRRIQRNTHWKELFANAIISMPDKWEYPWFAAWDLSFHTVALALIDIDFAKEQLFMLLSHRFMHSSGQIPSYEWAFSDLNPPTQAWALWKVYNQEKEKKKKGDLEFLEACFLKLISNFNWWVNKVDKLGNNFFEGGFLGLDNISVFDRSKKCADGGMIEESDGTGWMGFYALKMMHIALELSEKNPLYQSLAFTYFEHFVYISQALHSTASRALSMWDEKDGFFYDIISKPNGEHQLLKVRSFVGIIPLYSIGYIEDKKLKKFAKFYQSFLLFLEENQALTNRCITTQKVSGKKRYLFSLMDLHQMKKVLEKVADPDEFYSPFGVRSLSKYHLNNPYQFEGHTVRYEPAESLEKIKGGNSNWRGPIWLPTNYLLLEALKALYEVVDDTFKIVSNQQKMTLRQLQEDLRKRLISLFVKDQDNIRPLFSDVAIYQQNADWEDLLLFFEHYHAETGRGLGASHQTGWSGLIANLIKQKP